MLIPVQYYTTVYYIFISSIIFLSILPLFNVNLENYPYTNARLFFFLLSVIIILFIGFRDPWGSPDYLGDTIRYTKPYENIKLNGLGKKEWRDPAFYTFMYLCTKLMNIQGFYLLCAFLYVIPVAYTFKKYFANYALFAFIVYVSGMSFWNFGINGLRNGLAVSAFIFSLNYVNRKWLMLFIILLSISIHKGMLLPAIAFLLGTYIKNTKLLILIWAFVAVLMYFFGDQIEFFISDFLNQTLKIDNRTKYIFSHDYDDIIQRRYRLDFAIYSAVPIVLGYWFIQIRGYNNKFYAVLLNTYIISNTVWLFMIYAAFTSRIAFLSWFLMPIILIYPLLKVKLVKNQGEFIGLMILASLVFTITTEFIL